LLLQSILGSFCHHLDMANYLKTVACALAVVLLASLDDFCNRTRIRV